MATRKRAVRAPSTAQNIAVSIAMLEQQAQQTTAQFVGLSDKFERILEKVEQLTLNTTTLISRHDSQIQVLQKQLAGAEDTMRETRDKIDEMNTQLSEQLTKHINEALADMSHALEEVSGKMTTQHERFDTRLRSLERWRWMLIGAGAALGIMFTKAIDILKIFS